MIVATLVASGQLIAVDVTGMPPQLERALVIAKAQGWTVTCKGRAGEEGVLRFGISTGTNHEAVDTALGGRSAFVSSTVYYYAGKPMPRRCDHKPVRVSGGPPTPVLEIGSNAALVALLDLARSCGYKRAIVRDFRKSDPPLPTMVIPTGWRTLDAGEDVGIRYGPTICFIQLQRSALATPPSQ
jgi:hypothetical protein